MEQSPERTQFDYESDVLAILKNPQQSTSVTKFAGPYITSIVLQNNEDTNGEEGIE